MTSSSESSQKVAYLNYATSCSAQVIILDDGFAVYGGLCSLMQDCIYISDLQPGIRSVCV